MINRFNIRAYGIVIQDDSVLLATETLSEFTFTKFPGGGLEFGEGLKDCLVREFREELDIEIDVLRHFYTTDFFQKSVFRPNDQVISVYYLVSLRSQVKEYRIQIGVSHNIVFSWKKMHELKDSDLTFPIDKLVLKLLKGQALYQ